MFSYEKLRPSLKMFYFLLNLMNCSHKNRNVYIPFFVFFAVLCRKCSTISLSFKDETGKKRKLYIGAYLQ